jgi:nucleoside-diphosphate-sugar epimerase
MGTIRVAVTGASGFLGRHFVRELTQEPDVVVHALAHAEVGQTHPPTENLMWIRGSIEDKRCLRQLLDRDGCLVHLAYPPNWDTERHIAATTGLARAAAEIGVRRFVHCSTAMVVGSVAVTRVDEDTPCNPVTTYERTKLMIEQTLSTSLEGVVELAVLRPSAILGIDGKNLIKLARELTWGSRYTNYARSCLMGRRTMNLVCVENVSTALLFLLKRKQSSVQETYFVSDDDDPGNNFRNIEQALMEHLCIPDYGIPILPLPPFVLAAALRLLGRSCANPCRVYDSSRLVYAGYRKTKTLTQGIDSFARWFRESQ